MISYKELLKNKVVFSLIIIVIILIILSIIFPISLFQNLTTQFSIITALILPFIIKGIERKEKERDEKDIVIQIIKRVKGYLKYLMNTKKRGYYRFSGSMSFIHFISQKFPEILIKIGIEINQKEEEDVHPLDMGKATYRSSELYILDKYLIGLDPICKLISLDENKEIINKKEFERVMRELINHVNDVFSFKVSKELAKF